MSAEVQSLIRALEQADLAAGVALARHGADGAFMLRFALLRDADGADGALTACIPAQVGAEVRADYPLKLRQEVATALRRAATVLDAAVGDAERSWTAGDLNRILRDLERSHKSARGSDALLELRVRLGRLGLPESPA